MIEIDRPCKDCQKRHIGCHAECEDYKKMREEAQKKKVESKKDKGLAMSKTFLIASTHKRNRRNGYNGYK